MFQIVVTIANGNSQVEEVFAKVNAGILKRHHDLGLDISQLAFVTDCPSSGRVITPLPYPYFNCAVKHFQYVHAIKVCGIQSQDVLLRDADTLILKAFDFPASPEHIGFVRWRYANWNCGAVYVSRDALSVYESLVAQMHATNQIHDEQFVKSYLKQHHAGTVQLLPPQYNWDARNGECDDALLLHVHRRSSSLPTNYKKLFGEYSAEGLIGRGKGFFGKYGVEASPS